MSVRFSIEQLDKASRFWNTCDCSGNRSRKEEEDDIEKACINSICTFSLEELKSSNEQKERVVEESRQSVIEIIHKVVEAHHKDNVSIETVQNLVHTLKSVDDETSSTVESSHESIAIFPHDDDNNIVNKEDQPPVKEKEEDITDPDHPKSEVDRRSKLVAKPKKAKRGLVTTIVDV